MAARPTEHLVGRQGTTGTAFYSVFERSFSGRGPGAGWPDADERQEAAIVKFLDRIDRNIQRVERDIGIANEAFANFMRSWLTATASVPEAAQAAARAKGGERYDRFLQALGRRFPKWPRFLQEIPEEGVSSGDSSSQ